MSHSHDVSSKEKLIHTIFCRLQKAERGHCTRSLFHFKNGWVNWLAMQRYSVIHIWSRLQLLPTLDRMQRLWQNSFHIASSAIEISRTPFRSPHELGSYQQTMDVILSPVKGQVALVYCRDIIIYYKREPKIYHVLVLYCHSYKNLVSQWILELQLLYQKIVYLEHVMWPG